MFAISVVDEIRLSFGHVVQNYTLHARAAERLATLGLKVRLVILALLALATSASILGLFLGHAYQVAAAIMAGLALVGYAIYIATSIETRMSGHRAFAHRLWLPCERYKALLAETQDGLLDIVAILARRDALIKEVDAIYEQGFPVDQAAFETARQLAAESEPDGVSEQSPSPSVPHVTPRASIDAQV
jgi:hypothetical protein